MTSKTSVRLTRLRIIGRHWLLGFATLALTGCSVGPKYRRPDVTVPNVYRGVDPAAGPQTAKSLGDEKWWTLFHDQPLQDLIRTALSQNYDVRIAATRVLEAEASLGITRADQFPTVAAGASATSERVARSSLFPEYETSPIQIDLTFAWELDFWGKFRNATKAARATLLSTQWGQEGVISTIVSDVAQAYFELLELDAELEISRTTLATRKDSLRLVQIRQHGGTTSMMDVYQSEQLVYGAAAALPDLERRIQQQENFISILLGKNPGPIPRGAPLAAFTIAPTVPAGIPSSLLIRRPDIQSTEASLIAANAQIAVARAAYFPQITLTASGGFQSVALSNLLTGPAGMWSFGGQLLQPIFTGGKITSTVRLTEAQKQEAVLLYQQTIQQAFRQVSDSLVAYQKNQDFRIQQELLTNSAQNAAQLSNVRYAGGVTSYLEVLDSDTRYYEAQINLAQAQLNERLALVQLYTALGGGWQQ